MNPPEKTPPASSQAARNRMRAAKHKNTKPELALQALLIERGMTFKTDQPVISKSRLRADIVFEKERIVVFVDGCFWHGCPIHGTWPKANAEFWKSKIERNKERDKDTDHQLTEAGWIVIRVWAHEDPIDVADRIEGLIGKKSD